MVLFMFASQGAAQIEQIEYVEKFGRSLWE